MDFGALPPEINSARMYAGAGAGPMMAAASAWSSLGSELSTTAASYESVISTLTGDEWLGPSSCDLVEHHLRVPAASRLSGHGVSGCL